MNDKIRIFKLREDAEFYGYQVEGVYQEYHPQKEGFVEMTYDEALFEADEVYKRLHSVEELVL